MSSKYQKVKKINSWLKVNVFQLVEILNNYTHIQIGKKRYSVAKSWDKIVRDWQAAWKEAKKPKKVRKEEVK